MKTKLRSVFIGLALLVGVHPALAQPAFLCGAVLGVLGRDVVVKLSAAWGGLGKHKSLVEATLDWLKCPSPKLVPPRRPARHGRRYDLIQSARSLKIIPLLRSSGLA